MRAGFCVLAASVLALCGCSRGYDVCVYGGTASGVMAAYAAAQMGMDVVVVEPTESFGGMTTGGLGLTDIGNKQVVKGLGLQFYRRVGARYGTLESWVFEPKVASEVLAEYLDHPRIKAVAGYHLCGADKPGTALRSVRVARGTDTLRFRARWFIDASYEGDLMAAAGVTYRIGREDNAEYGETWDGVQLLDGHQFPDGVDPFVVPGDPSSGLLWGICADTLRPAGSGDTLVQAYNYRICLTDSLENRIPITAPAGYDPSRYELLVRLYGAQPDQRKVSQYFIWSPMPNRKTDINNRGAFSTDLVGMNHLYPEASWEERQDIIRAHRDYSLGLLYFTATDPRVPAEIRDEVARWGLPKDEYPDNGHWSPQLYVRESRRMVGEYVATQADCENRRTAPDGIAMAAYTMDSHNCQRIVVRKDGRYMVKNEGNVEVRGGHPYPVSYRSLTPRREECTNLLVPVCCSASHIAYGSIRMEPVFMCMGQAAGIAVATAARKGLSSVQEVDYRDILQVLSDDPCQDGSAPDIVIDDLEAEMPEGWSRIAAKGSYGPSAAAGPSGSGAVRFSTVVPAAGTYDVYTYQHRPEEGFDPVTVVTFPDGSERRFHDTDVKIVGQTRGAWHPLGSVSLPAGETFTLCIGGGSATGQGRADAVLLVRRQP